MGASYRAAAFKPWRPLFAIGYFMLDARRLSGPSRLPGKAHHIFHF
jgi:hypothetical protein